MFHENFKSKPGAYFSPIILPFLITTTPRVELSVNAISIKYWTFSDFTFWLSGITVSHDKSG